MRIFLLGYMGSGKSTFGPKLAEALNIGFADLDDAFETQYKISIHDFFGKYGEELFREFEHNLLHSLVLREDIVISTGGGTPCFKGNMDLMKKAGITVYLKTPLEVLKQRLTDSPRIRPLLIGTPAGGLDAKLLKHLEDREQFYNQSQIIIDGSNPDPVEFAALLHRTNLILPVSE